MDIDYNKLEQLIREIFADGLDYREATQLCITLFCCSFPNVKEFELSKEELAVLFSRLVDNKLILVQKREFRETAKKLGISKFKVNTCEHWLNVCLAILKFGDKVINRKIENQLISKIENFNVTDWG
jgi:hypothetical protein